MSRERGALSPAVMILAVMIFTMAGLVIDGGRQLGARSRAVGYAQEAARAGAATIDLNASEVRIDVTKAGAQVDKFCAQVKSNDPAVVGCRASELNAEFLRVDVELQNKTTFLSMVGVQKLTAKGSGEAHAEQGINKADETPTVPPLTVIPTEEGPGATIRPTATEPTLIFTCPPLTIGSPLPTLSPFPLPTTCTPSISPTDTTLPSETPSESPSESPGR
jgi:Putative Flp pilus-assembly TadE/G-like